MPHQCTNCDRLFPDGSKEMLSGCPGCGGSKFQFLPSGAVDEDELSAKRDDDPAPGSGDMQFGHAAGDELADARNGSAASTAGNEPGGTEKSDQTIIDADARAQTPREDSAQANARRTVISEDELRDADVQAAEAESPADDEEETPDLSALRAELNEQFESIKILEPGQYELNLMELYDREEYIIALEEDGRYAIEVPDSWREDEP